MCSRSPLYVTALLVLLSSPLSSDGGFFFQEVAAAGSSADQRAIILYDQGQETLVVQTAVQDTQSFYAWIIPTPGVVEASSIAEVDATAFDLLSELTAPRVWSPSGEIPPPIGCGCGPMGGMAGGGDNGMGGPVQEVVTVFETVQVGAYEVTTLSAIESAALVTWLTDNGFAVPEGAAPVLTDYIDRGWVFTAIRVTELPQDTSSVSLSPLALTFPTDTPVFPLRISSVSAAEADSSILLYVIAAQRVTVSPFDTVELDDGPLQGAGTAQEAYDQRLRVQADGEQGPAFVVESVTGVSGEEFELTDVASLPAYPHSTHCAEYVTRLRTFMTPAEMSADLEFADDGANVDPQYGPYSNTFQPYIEFVGPNQTAQTPPASVLALFGLAGGAAAGGGARRRAVTGLLATVLAALVLL